MTRRTGTLLAAPRPDVYYGGLFSMDTRPPAVLCVVDRANTHAATKISDAHAKRRRLPFGTHEIERSPVRVMRVLAICSLGLLALIGVFIALLAVTLSFTDDSRIVANLREAIAVGALTPDNYPLSPFGHGGLMNDQYTDCLAFGTDLANKDKSLIYRIAAAPHIGSDQLQSDYNPCADLINSIMTGTAKATAPMSRLWHGDLVYLRPMLSMMSLPKLRRANAILLYAALLLLAYRFFLLFGPWAFPVVLLPFAASADLLTMPLVTAHTVGFIWIFLSVAIIAISLDRWSEKIEIIVALSALSGAIYNFVSYVTNASLAPALIGFLVMTKSLSSTKDHGRVRRAIVNAGLVVTSWFAGFAIVWIAKWLFAASVLGTESVMSEVVINATGSEYRSATMAHQAHILTPTLFVLSKGFSYLEVCIATSWAVAAAILAWCAATRRLTVTDITDFLMLQLPLLIPVIWVEIMRYRSIEHPGQVFRDFLVFEIFPILAALMVARRAVVQRVKISSEKTAAARAGSTA